MAGVNSILIEALGYLVGSQYDGQYPFKVPLSQTGVESMRITANTSDNEAIVTTGSCQQACELLSIIRPGTVHHHGTAGYNRAQLGFWSQTQRELRPRCIYQPRSPQDVSLATVVLRGARCPFAVKSGGHGKFGGESTVDDGITIDLAYLDRLEVSEDARRVVLGPGLRWLDVYSSLETMGIIVAGGRDADVGVGGFLLGGGISFHSSQYGFGVDTVQSFEVVLANGTITTASPESNPDLYKALRGGGSNFAIVVSFTLEAVPYRGMWGGKVWVDYSQTDRLLAAFMSYGRLSDEDPKSSLILNFALRDGAWIWSNDVEYCDPVVGGGAALREIVAIPSILDESTLTSISNLTLGLAKSTWRGRRNSYWALATKFDERILRYFVDTWITAMNAIRGGMTGFEPTFNLQVITPGMRRGFAKNGGNLLGLAGSEEPLILYNPTPRWTEANQDDTIYEAVSGVIHKVKTEAVRLGQDHDYLYMNYASQFQDPLASYGEEMQAFIQGVVEKYDPEQFFQNLQPGSFKVGGRKSAAAQKHPQV
ncbi:FAD binding domain-containing protein [Xylariales sp. PMI_506]|nr:FAD binding domain-containing protein [Xylariales sp. PMI_506]